MSELNGKWELIHSNHTEAILRATGFSEEDIKKLVPLLDATGNGGLVEEYIIDSTTVRRILYVGGKLLKESPIIPIDKEYEGMAIGNRLIKVLITVPTPNRVEETETGSNYKSTLVREVFGHSLFITQKTESGVESTRKYKKVHD